MQYSISLKHVSKSFSLKRPGTFKKLVSNIGRKDEKIDVLKDITFKIKRGEAIGIHGSNGSGKSTLLRIISGIVLPDSGQVTVNGDVASIIELGSGLHHDLSGIDNIFLYASILGIPRPKIKKYLKDIIAFSELESFIDIPIKKYSSGMRARLAFSVAIFSEADILLFDEVFAVGDMSFRDKSMRLLKEIGHKKTIILTSHDWGLMSRICDKFLILENGELINEQNELAISFLKNLSPEETYVATAKSNSMYPFIKKDQNMTFRRDKFENILVGDVIAFAQKNIPEIIVHRVIDILISKGEKIFITRGDNSTNVDSFEIRKQNYLGKVIKVE